MMRLLLAEIRRSWTMFKRYPTEAVTMVITFSAVFLALFLGARYIAGPSTSTSATFGTRLDAIIVSYLLWSLTMAALSEMGWTIQFESMTGTLEQVYLSPYGPIRVFVARAIADLAIQFGVIAVVFGIILAITHTRLHVSAGILLPVLTIMLATYGLGYVLGGLTLIFKRIQNVLQVSQFVLLFLVAVPVEHWHGPLRLLGAVIPLAPGSGMIREIMVRNAPFSSGDFAIALANGVGYFLLGMLLFTLGDREAKKRGLLGGY